ncbi:hypothetical protein MCEGE10_02843 [Flavobacteriaceae bacterium]
MPGPEKTAEPFIVFGAKVIIIPLLNTPEYKTAPVALSVMITILPTPKSVPESWI